MPDPDSPSQLQDEVGNAAMASPSTMTAMPVALLLGPACPSTEISGSSSLFHRFHQLPYHPPPSSCSHTWPKLRATPQRLRPAAGATRPRRRPAAAGRLRVGAGGRSAAAVTGPPHAGVHLKHLCAAAARLQLCAGWNGKGFTK